ncbi:MAG: PKD domain-containing protein, partial [Thermoplasmata archaeon]|nr:PKD domain-containing protein [Thermoplasmata archaeon]
VAHSYQLAGTYTANVSVHSSIGDGNASVTVHAGTSDLSAVISATPLMGPAPLTVRFISDISGGTGTYTAILWRFGDGGNGIGSDLAYTYTTPGNYYAHLNVTDSSGVTASTSIEVVVSAGTSPTSPPAHPTPSYVEFALPIALVLAAFAVLAVAYRALVARRTESAAPPPSTRPTAPPPAEVQPSGPSTPEAMAAAASSRPGGEDSLRLSERILVHLYWYGRPTSDGVARPDSSQAGMARRLGVAQNALSKSLARLIDSGAVHVELRHVPGASRRLKTYSLSQRGEAVARSIRAEPERRPPT